MSRPGEDSRARPLTSKGHATRARIVAAAADLMFEQGVATTTMDDVRSAAGVSSSQIYHYFENKDSLVRAVIAYQSDRVVGSQEPMLAGLDTLDGIRAWRDFLLGHQRQLEYKGGCPIGALGSELAEVDALARGEVASAFSRWEAGIRGGLRAMSDRGELAEGTDPDRLATATLAAVQGALLLVQIHRDPGPLEAAMDTVIDHIQLLTVSPA
jgi:TetR/AcrR family transcriptional regulator, transcriptional repressor for nem operon